jgi:protease stability complex PrcB-like protein
LSRVGASIAVALVLLVAAGVVWERRERTDVREIPYRGVDLGTIDLGAPIGKRIRLQKSLDLILGSRRYVIPPGRMTVLISPGPRSSSGYSVRVVSVTEQRRRIVVRVHEDTPRLVDRVRPVVTYPYRMIVIPLLPKPVRVSWEGRGGVSQ